MKALRQIIRRVAENPSRPWALATLVQAEGSTDRKPGVGLPVDSDGGTLGVLSGGCLEEIARHGQKVIGDASPVLLSFDTKRLYGCVLILGGGVSGLCALLRALVSPRRRARRISEKKIKMVVD